MVGIKTCRSRCRSPYPQLAGGSARALANIDQYGTEGLRFWTKNKKDYPALARWWRGWQQRLRHSDDGGNPRASVLLIALCAAPAETRFIPIALGFCRTLGLRAARYV